MNVHTTPGRMIAATPEVMVEVMMTTDLADLVTTMMATEEVVDVTMTAAATVTTTGVTIEVMTEGATTTAATKCPHQALRLQFLTQLRAASVNCFLTVSQL